jgi:hypothetical protein
VAGGELASGKSATCQRENRRSNIAKFFSDLIFNIFQEFREFTISIIEDEKNFFKK